MSRAYAPKNALAAPLHGCGAAAPGRTRGLE